MKNYKLTSGDWDVSVTIEKSEDGEVFEAMAVNRLTGRSLPVPHDKSERLTQDALDFHVETDFHYMHFPFVNIPFPWSDSYIESYKKEREKI